MTGVPTELIVLPSQAKWSVPAAPYVASSCLAEAQVQAWTLVARLAVAMLPTPTYSTGHGTPGNKDVRVFHFAPGNAVTDKIISWVNM